MLKIDNNVKHDLIAISLAGALTMGGLAGCSNNESNTDTTSETTVDQTADDLDKANHALYVTDDGYYDWEITGEYYLSLETNFYSLKLTDGSKIILPVEKTVLYNNKSVEATEGIENIKTMVKEKNQ